MVICYFEKKTFVYIHLIFTLCANLQYISDHLKSNSSSASPPLAYHIIDPWSYSRIYLSVAVEDCGLRGATTNFILCGGVLS